MIRLLSFLGRHSSRVLLIGLFAALALSSVSSVFRPFLPALVSLVLGLAIARINIRSVFSEFTSVSKTLKLLGLVMLMMPVTSLLLIVLWREIGLEAQYELLLLVFVAAPPLSSAASLSLILGYNARLTLQLTILAQLLTPIVGPLCFAIADVPINIELMAMAIRIALMIAGGFLIGIVLQLVLGKSIIERHPDAFNGVVALSMVLFLLPVFEGVVAYIIEEPLHTFYILILAIVLNLGSHLMVRAIAKCFTEQSSAKALGLMFGNRNIAIYLAALPVNPLLSIFIACSQIPMYATPALLGKHVDE